MHASAISELADDSITSVQCGTDETLVGCSGHSESAQFDGAFPSTNNTCSAQNGFSSPSGAYADAVCLDNTLLLDAYTLECVVVSGAQSTFEDREGESRVSCPSSEYFMSSCSAQSDWNAIARYFIEGEDDCTVSNNKYGAVVASAIWCVRLCV